MDSKEIKAKIKEQGWIRANAMFELLGSPKEHVEKVIKAYVGKLKENKKSIIAIKEYYSKAEEKEGGLWSTFAECELLIDKLDTLNWMCINFMPASIEILEPDSFTFQGRELVNWLNDMLSKLHEVGTMTRQASSDNKLLMKNINALLRNYILTLLKQGPIGAEELSKSIGVGLKELEPLFEAMIEEKTLLKDGDKYVRGEKRPGKK